MPDYGTYDGDDVWYNSLHGDLVEVQKAVEAGAPVDHVGVRGWTPLFAACARGHADVVQTLLQSGADTEIETDNGWRALMTAAQQGNDEIVSMLLGAAADPNVRNRDGHTALQLAEIANMSGAVDMLKPLTEIGTPALSENVRATPGSGARKSLSARRKASPARRNSLSSAGKGAGIDTSFRDTPTSSKPLKQSETSAAFAALYGEQQAQMAYAQYKEENGMPLTDEKVDVDDFLAYTEANAEEGEAAAPEQGVWPTPQVSTPAGTVQGDMMIAAAMRRSSTVGEVAPSPAPAPAPAMPPPAEEISTPPAQVQLAGTEEGEAELFTLLEPAPQAVLPVPVMASPPPAPSFSAAAVDVSEGDDEKRPLLRIARRIFDSADLDGNGRLERHELFAKLKADDEIEMILGRQPIDGSKKKAFKAMGRLLVALDTDGEENMGEGLGVISWEEFEAAVLRADAKARSEAAAEEEAEEPPAVAPAYALRPNGAVPPMVLPSPGGIAAEAAAIASARQGQPYISPLQQQQQAAAEEEAESIPSTPMVYAGEASPPNTKPQPGQFDKAKARYLANAPEPAQAVAQPTEVYKPGSPAAYAPAESGVEPTPGRVKSARAWLQQNIPPPPPSRESPERIMKQQAVERRLAVYETMEERLMSTDEQHALAELIKEAVTLKIPFRLTAAARRHLQIGKGLQPDIGLLPTPVIEHPQHKGVSFEPRDLLPPAQPPMPGGMLMSPVKASVPFSPPSRRVSKMATPRGGLPGAEPPAAAFEASPPWTCQPLGAGGGPQHYAPAAAQMPVQPPPGPDFISPSSTVEYSPLLPLQAAPAMAMGASPAYAALRVTMEPPSTAPAVPPPPPIAPPPELDAPPDWMMVEPVTEEEALHALRTAEQSCASAASVAHSSHDAHAEGRAGRALAMVQQVSAQLRRMQAASQAFQSGLQSDLTGVASPSWYAQAHISNASALYIEAARARAGGVSAAGEMRARAAALRALAPQIELGADAEMPIDPQLYRHTPSNEASLTLLTARASARRHEANVAREALGRLETLLAAAGDAPAAREVVSPPERPPPLPPSPFSMHVGAPVPSSATPAAPAPAMPSASQSLAIREAVREAERASAEAEKSEAELAALRVELSAPVSEEAQRLEFAASAVAKVAHFAAASYLRPASAQVSTIVRALGFFACGIHDCPLLVIPADLGKLPSFSEAASSEAAVEFPLEVHFLCAQTLAPTGPPLTVEDGHAFLATAAPMLKLCLSAVEAALLAGRPFDAHKFISVLQPSMAYSDSPNVIEAIQATHRQIDVFLVAAATLLARDIANTEDGAESAATGSPVQPAAQSLAALTPPEDLPAVLNAAVSHVFPSTSASSGARPNERLGRSQMLLSQELSAAGFVLLAEHARAQGTVSSGPWVRMMDVSGTTAWVCEPAADAWADDNCGHELQAVLPPIGNGDEAASSVFPMVNGPVGPGEACNLLGSSLVAAGSETVNGVGKAADDVFAGIAKGFGDAIGALADNFTKLGEKLAEGQPSRQQVAPAPAPVRDEAILKLTEELSRLRSDLDRAARSGSLSGVSPTMTTPHTNGVAGDVYA